MRWKAIAPILLLAYMGCSTAGDPCSSAIGPSPSGDVPMFNRDAFTDVYVRSVLPHDAQRQAEIDDLARSSDVNFIRLFLDDRVYAIVTPRAAGLRGANGNGPFLVYQQTDSGWCFVHESGGYEYQVQEDPKAPAIVSLERVSTDIARRNIERWNGVRFELVASERIEYPGD